MYARVAFFEDHDPAQIDELISRLDERSRLHAELLAEPGYYREQYLAEVAAPDLVGR